jgi:hypothetical protein
MSWSTDLQSLLDDVATRLGVPVALEDRRFRLIAYSAHTGMSDEVRTTSILTREAPPEVVRWLDSLHLDRAEEIVAVPENAELQMGGRLCAPARHKGVLLGYVWVIGELEGPQRETLADAATAAAGVVWRQRTLDEQVLHAEGELLARLLRSPDATSRQSAAVQVADEHGWRVSAPIVVMVARGSADEEPEGRSSSALAEIGQRAQSQLSARSLTYCVEPGQLVVLAQVAAPQGVEQVVTALGVAGASVLGVGGRRATLVEASESLREAELTSDVLTRVSGLGTVATWEDASAWALLLELYDGRRPELTESVRRLIDQPELAEAVETLLDHGGSLGPAASELHVHRATLHRRLQRAEQLTGLRLSSGDDRLLLHMGLRLWRLGAATDVAHPRPNL